MEVSAWRSATLSVCGRRLRTAVASLALQSWRPPGALDSDVYWLAQPLLFRNRTWNRLPTAYRSPELSLSLFKRQHNTHLFRTRQCWLKLWVSCTIVRCCYDCKASLAPTQHDSVLWHCWLSIRKSIQPVKIEWWCAGVVICLERGADRLHMFQVMPLPSPNPIISCLI